MEFRVDTRENTNVAVLENHGQVVLTTVQDALDLMATAKHLHDATRIVIPADAVCADFFELRTGLAGEVLQKYVNYGVRVAFVGDFSGYESKALRDFIRESNRGTHVNFLPTETQALDALHSGER